VVRADRAAVERTLAETGPSVVDYQLTDAGETTILQLHYRPSDLTLELLAIHNQHAVLLDYPLEYTGPENRCLRVSEIGREEALRRVIEETRSLVDVEIERLGTYDPIRPTSGRSPSSRTASEKCCASRSRKGTTRSPDR